MQCVNVKHWLGKSKAIGTNEYDDYFNKTDIILVPEGKGAGLAVDLTVGLPTSKLQYIRDELIARGTLAQIKYYLPLTEPGLKSARKSDGYPVPLPLVVVGLSREEMRKVVESYLKKEEGGVGDHVGLVMLYQIKLQLAHFLRYCEQMGKAQPVIWRQHHAYKKASSEIEKAWEEKIVELKLNDTVATNYAMKNEFTKTLSTYLHEILPVDNKNRAAA